MKIKFLGTGAAEGVPAVFCNCNVCKNIRALGESEFRTRTQVLIDGELSVDFPPDAFYHSLRFGAEFSKLKYLLVTHSHMDHFYAHDFILYGYKYAVPQQEKLEIFGNSEVKAVFDECTAREMKPEVREKIIFNQISSYKCFSAGDYRVIAVPASHEKKEDCLLYYIECGGKGYLHMYDTGRMDDNALKFLAEKGAKADMVAYDCTFVERTGGYGVRHMGIEDDMFIKQKLTDLGVVNEQTISVISHFSHNGNPTRAHLSELEKKYDVIAAYDGFEIEI